MGNYYYIGANSTGVSFRMLTGVYSSGLREVSEMEAFQKGSTEWMMFAEYWALCRKYWEPGESDEWWQSTLEEIDDFAKKYDSTDFVRGLCLILINSLETKSQKNAIQ